MDNKLLHEVFEQLKERKSVLVYGDKGKTELLKTLDFYIKNSIYVYPCSSKKFMELLCIKLGVKKQYSVVDSFNLCFEKLKISDNFVLIVDDFYEFDVRIRKVIWKLSKRCILLASSKKESKGFDVAFRIGKNKASFNFNPYTLMIIASMFMMLRYIFYMNRLFQLGYLVASIGYIFMMVYRIFRIKTKN
ncbi:MAG: hypothetical protein PHW96_03355 [Candidatus Nanoarchaeia archaeon]|nr:hypothetical protein [Candidatus Omnitrophota bacterium]MDD5417891.1 hypothetical protein [Candidatus Nanoarchaeia archaeon]